MSVISIDEFLAQSPADETPDYSAHFALSHVVPCPTSDTSVRVSDIAAFEGERIRVHIDGRKMPVPGRVAVIEGATVLATNWGLELCLDNEPVTRIDVKSVDTGRWVEQAIVHAA